jgi:hypothetical protein
MANVNTDHTPSSFTINYTSASGVNLPNAFIKIRMFQQQTDQYILIGYDIYFDESVYIQSGPAAWSAQLKRIDFDLTPGSDWMTYFDYTVEQQPGVDDYSQAIVYLQAKLSINPLIK